MVVDAVLAEDTMVPRGGRRATACQIPPRMDSCRCAVAAEAAGCSRGRDQDDDFEPGRSSPARACAGRGRTVRSEEHTSELQSLMRISYAVFCLKKKNSNKPVQQVASMYQADESVHYTNQ